MLDSIKRKMLTCATVCGLTIASSAHAQTPIFGDFGTPAWDRLFKVIEKRMGVAAKVDSALILPIATNAAWDDPIRAFRLMEMYNWGDQMPSKSWNYQRNPGKRVSDGYSYFLQAALVETLARSGAGTPDTRAATINVVNEVEFCRNDYNQTTASGDSAYVQYVNSKPSPRLSKNEFLKNQGWDRQIEVKRRMLVAALGRLEILSKEIVDPDVKMLSEAIQRFNNPKQKISLPPTREALNISDLWQSYYVSTIGNDIFAFLREPKLDSQVIMEASETSETFESRWKASVSVKFLGLIRAGGADAEQVRRETHIRNNLTQIAISFENLDVFPIVRGEWFSQNVIDNFAPKLKPETFNNLFGPNGQLEVIPQSLLVGRGTVIDVYAKSDSLDYLYEHFQASADAGFYIGYWKIGGGGEYSSTHEQTKIYKYADRIRVVDLSGRGKVLAVLGKEYGAAGLKTVPLPAAVQNLLAADKLAAATRAIEAQWTPSTLMKANLGGLAPEVSAEFSPQ